VGLSPLGTAATCSLLYKPQMIDEVDCGEIGGMKIGRGNRSTRRKPAPAPLWPPQIPHDETRARTRAAAVGSQRLTAWAMARPELLLLHSQNGWKLQLIRQNNKIYLIIRLLTVNCLQTQIYLRNLIYVRTNLKSVNLFIASDKTETKNLDLYIY
jgi:hypothetical protein